MGLSGSDVWRRAQERLQAKVDEHSFKNWFTQTEYKDIDGNCLTVGVPSKFFADWLREHYHDVICDSVREFAPEIVDVRFEPAAETASLAHIPSPAAPVSRVEAKTPSSFFNPRYTFERFVVGNGNRFAHAAAQAVAENPARAYNPLFLYGATGLGKTHLMHAIGHEIVRRNTDRRIAFISSESFTNQLIGSIAKKATQRFREHYRKVDVLLIDDVHFIAGKEATQEEFFHTFNALFDKHKQIVLSSDRPPKEISGLETRLVSRFEWGLVTDINPPDLETRVAILQNRAAQENTVVDVEPLRYIATYITNNIRELEGAFITVLAFSKLERKPITIPLVETVLSDLILREAVRSITADAVQKAVADHFDVRVSDLKSKNRQRQIAFPRQVAMYLCKNLIPKLSLNEIGEAFGGKDHSTVIHACKKIAEEANSNAVTRQLLAQLEKQIRA